MEVQQQLDCLHNGRASGHACLPAELLRYAKEAAQPGQPSPPHLLAPALAELISCLFRNADVPASLNLGLVTPVFERRGSRADAANYRPIAVTEPVMRLYAGILNQRLAFTEDRLLLADSQAGFRPHLAVRHQVFAVRHLIDKQVAAGQKLFVCFLDLTAAYDRVSRPLLWEVPRLLGVHGAMLAVV